MLNVRISPFLQSDANDVYAMLQNTEELHVGARGLTYSDRAVQGWHVTRSEDVLLMAEVDETPVGLIAAKVNDPEQGVRLL